MVCSNQHLSSTKYIVSKLKTYFFKTKKFTFWSSGLTDRTSEDGWRWEDGEPTGYLNWGEGQPNDADGGEDCVSLTRTGAWDDVPCNHKGHFVCEKSSDPEFAKKINKGEIQMTPILISLKFSQFL